MVVFLQQHPGANQVSCDLYSCESTTGILIGDMFQLTRMDTRAHVYNYYGTATIKEPHMNSYMYVVCEAIRLIHNFNIFVMFCV